MTRRRILFAVLLLLLAGGGAWVFSNASLSRLRAEFLPWMERLGRWRDGCESVQRALKRADAAPGDPGGIAPLRAWAWRGLDRISYAGYEVSKPSQAIGPAGERTLGWVLFTVGGFRRDGTRVERVARASVEVRAEAGGARPVTRVLSSSPVSERSEPAPRFRDGTREAGLGAPRHDPPFRLTNRLIADIWPGSGVAVLDYDQDGAEDLFVGDGVRSILYRNDGHGRFTDVTVAAGLARSATEGVPATGVAAGDVDGDGFPDIFVTDAFGPAHLFRNRRDGTFEDVTAASGIRVPKNARSAAFADVDGDGDLDLFVAVTGDYYNQMPDPPFDANDGRANLLFLNDGHGHFTDATKAWGIEKATRWSLSSLFADYDGDGRPDLLVTNDFGLKNLYRNEGRSFRDVTDKAGAQVRAYGMSAAWADFDGDGRLDLYTTGCDTQWYFLHEYPGLPIPLAGRLFLPIAIDWMEVMTRGNSLLLQTENGRFTNATGASGARRAGWNWSVVAADLDNDSWPDLYATNGMWGDGRDHDRELEFWWETLAYWDDYIAGRKTFDRQGAGIAGIERDRYFHNRGADAASAGARFEERGFLDGLDLETNGRAVVAFDSNGDGALDVYVRSIGAPEALFVGERKANEHFLRVRLRGAPGIDNSDGIGARLTATFPDGRRVIVETGNASGYLATGSPIAHFGLGSATRLRDLSIRWPSGRVQSLGAIDAVDRLLVIRERSERSPIK